MAANGSVNVARGGFLAGIAVILGVASFVALVQLATPANFSERRDKIGAEIESARERLRSGRTTIHYARSAVCNIPAQVAADDLRDRVKSAAATSGLSISGIVATASPPGEDAQILNTATFQFEANGRLDQVISVLRTLAEGTPTIFVDTADLQSHVTDVNLKLTGRVFCAVHVQS